MTKEEELQKLYDLYNDKVAYSEIASQLGHSRDWVRLRVQKGVDNGTLKVREKRVGLAANNSVAKRTEMRYALICDYYRNGYLLDEIATEMNLSGSSVQEYINNARKRGDIVGAYDPERKKAVEARHPGALGKKATSLSTGRLFNKNKPVTVKSTLDEGKTVKCDCNVSRTCVYGVPSVGPMGIKCRYALITNKCRSVGPDGCKHSACTKYSKITKDNPRLEIAGSD